MDNALVWLTLPLSASISLLGLTLYAARGASLLALVHTAIAWSLGLLSVALVPPDIVSTVDGGQRDALGSLWRVVWLGALIDVNFLLPIAYEFERAANFTTGRRLYVAVVNNLRYAFVTAFAVISGIILMLIVGVSFSLASLIDLLFGLSNGLGLFFCAILMSHGAVTLPTRLLRYADAELRIARSRLSVGRRISRHAASIASLKLTTLTIRAIVLLTTRGDPMRGYVEELRQDARIESRRPLTEDELVELETAHGSDWDNKFLDDEQGVANLRRMLWDARADTEAGRVALRDALCAALAASHQSMGPCWQTVTSAVALLAGVACCFLSVCFAVAEFTLVVPRSLRLAAAPVPPLGLFILTALPLGYGAACVWSSLATIRLNVLNFKPLQKGHSAAADLLSNAGLAARLAPALAFNAMQLLHVDASPWLAQRHLHTVFHAEIGRRIDTLPAFVWLNSLIPLLSLLYTGLALSGALRRAQAVCAQCLTPAARWLRLNNASSTEEGGEDTAADNEAADRRAGALIARTRAALAQGISLDAFLKDGEEEICALAPAAPRAAVTPEMGLDVPAQRPRPIATHRPTGSFAAARERLAAAVRGGRPSPNRGGGDASEHAGLLPF